MISSLFLWEFHNLKNEGSKKLLHWCLLTNLSRVLAPEIFPSSFLFQTSSKLEGILLQCFFIPTSFVGVVFRSINFKTLLASFSLLPPEFRLEEPLNNLHKEIESFLHEFFVSCINFLSFLFPPSAQSFALGFCPRNKSGVEKNLKRRRVKRHKAIERKSHYFHCQRCFKLRFNTRQLSTLHEITHKTRFDLINLHDIKMHITQHNWNEEIPLILKFSIIMLSLVYDVYALWQRSKFLSFFIYVNVVSCLLNPHEG